MDILRHDFDLTTGLEEEKADGLSELFTSFEAHEENNKSIVPEGVSTKYLDNVIPTHLLMVSFLEHICSLYEPDEKESNKLFEVLCEQLVEMKLTPSFTTMNDFKAIRRKYQRALVEWLHLTTRGISPKWTINASVYNEYKVLSKVQPPLYGVKKPHVLASRYNDEFEEYEQVGYGGFGSVFKVRNNLDGRTYAVKKIHLSEEDYKECQRVLREVKVLAKLAHPNVVRYYSAWLEYSRSFKPKCQNQDKHWYAAKEVNDVVSRTSYSDSSCASDNSSILFQDSVTEDKMSRNPVFCGNMESSITFHSQGQTGPDSTGKSADQSKRRSSLTHSCGPIVPCHYSRFNRSLSSDSAKHRSYDTEWSYPRTRMSHPKLVDNDCSSLALKEFGLIMFIQMEMCSCTLKDWLVERNNSLTMGDSVDWSINVHIIRHLLCGVRYIHKTGLIHRDLKPKNIFINPSKDSRHFEVKIGDFGLARSTTLSADGLLHLVTQPTNEKLFTSLNESPIPTSGVGTCTYAAPEQLNNSHYSLKADIYSLGIILFELFCPFRTEMERAMALKALRDGKVPEEMETEWPTESEIIKSMIREDPTLRPSADELLQHPLFFDKDVIIAMLKKELAKKDAEIVKLKNQIKVMSLINS